MTQPMTRDPRPDPDPRKMPDDPPERDPDSGFVKEGTEDRDPPPPTRADWDRFYNEWVHGSYDDEPLMQFAFRLGRDYERRIADDTRDTTPEDPRGR